jgi:hypothetical protein
MKKQNYELLEGEQPKRGILSFIKKIVYFIGKVVISIIYYPIVICGVIFLSIITLAYFIPILLGIAGILFFIFHN